MNAGADPGCCLPRRATRIQCDHSHSLNFPPARVSAGEMEAPQAPHKRKNTLTSSQGHPCPSANVQQTIPYANSWGNREKNALLKPKRIKVMRGESLRGPGTPWAVSDAQTSAPPLGPGLGRGHGVSMSLWHYWSLLHLQLKTMPRQTVKIST